MQPPRYPYSLLLLNVARQGAPMRRAITQTKHNSTYLVETILQQLSELAGWSVYQVRRIFRIIGTIFFSTSLSNQSINLSKISFFLMPLPSVKDLEPNPDGSGLLGHQGPKCQLINLPQSRVHSPELHRSARRC